MAHIETLHALCLDLVGLLRLCMLIRSLRAAPCATLKLRAAADRVVIVTISV